MHRRFYILLTPLFFLIFMPVKAAILPESVYLEELTWPEIKHQLDQGSRTVIIPSGGTEQNGPHIALGKHNWIVYHTAGAIAKQLGNALVAPVIPYVPEGNINPPQGHMLFPGTISVREEIFEGLLEDTARSLKQAGFTLICLIGDSGGNQAAQLKIAHKLNHEWKGQATVLNVTDYYAPKAADSWAAKHRFGHGDAAGHAGFMDTSETLATHPSGVRHNKIIAYDTDKAMETGVVGNPQGASAEYGKTLLSFKISAAVKQIRKAQD
jgi:creatinine amidohydrolase/Fe(II)-dependent formamide hydrolase-like protein